MNEKVKTWVTVAGVALALTVAALIYFLQPDILKQSGLGTDDLSGGVIAGLIAWLALRGKNKLTERFRVVLGTAICVGLLLGFTVFFLA